MKKTLINHGGDIYTEGLLKGKELIDFSSNINLLGVPKSFDIAMSDALKLVSCYPDIKYRETKDAIIKYHDMDIHYENIILGNGAAEVLDLAISSLKRLCIIAPSFSEYELSARKYNVEVTYSYLTKYMEYDYKDITNKLINCDGLIIANPNNPNGCSIDKDIFEEILNYCEENNKKIIIDEAFVEFSGNKSKSLIDKVSKYKSLIIIRAITKFFALPGIRLGWAISSDTCLMNELRELQLPWNINTFAAISVKYILQDNHYIEKSLEVNKLEKDFLISSLNNLGIFEKIFQSNANFILCKLKNASDDDIFNYALQKGILIRKCGMYKGIDNSYIRLAIKSRDNNKALITVLKEFMLTKGECSCDY